MSSTLRTLFMTALLGTAPALAVSFGNLNVTPRGPQNLNLETGATDLPQGGTATDAKTGLKPVAAPMHIQPANQPTAPAPTATLRPRPPPTAHPLGYLPPGRAVPTTGPGPPPPHKGHPRVGAP